MSEEGRSVGSVFNESKKNNYELSNDKNERAINQIEAAAKQTADHMGVSEVDKTGVSMYEIKESSYQSIDYRFKLSESNFCTCQLSAPASFSGDVRMWITRNGRKLWAKLSALQEFDGKALFRYLGGKSEKGRGSFDQRSLTQQKKIAQAFGDTEFDARNSEKTEERFEPDDELPF